MIAIYVSVLALFISLALVPLLFRWAGPLGLMDAPGPRKIHDRAIPRVGGIAIALGTLVPMVVWLPMEFHMVGFVVGATVIVAFGIADDRFDLDYRLKLGAQIAAALLFVAISGVHLTRAPFVYATVLPDWLGLPITVLVLVAITNAINLADGMDGLAGGTGLIAAVVFGYLAYLGGDNEIALLALCLIGATFGFLRYNTFPARVFMGDAGSQFLGFSVAVLGLLVIERSNTVISPFVPVLVLGLPILDTLYVIVRRLREGRSPFAPDRKHLHHRLLDARVTQYEALLIVYGLQAVLITLALVLRHAHDAVLLLAFTVYGGALYYALHWWRSRPTHARAIARRLDVVEPLVDFLKAKDVLRRIGHAGVVYGMSLLFIAVPWWVPGVPADIGWLALLLSIAALLAQLPLRMMPRVQIYRLVAFAVSVFVVYLFETTDLRGLPSVDWLRGYLFLIAACVALWMRFGAGGDFRLNTLDVLVVLIVAIVPQMPVVRDLGIGLMVFETLLLFYACELIFGERAGDWRVFRLSVLVGVATLAVRGIWLTG
jgi:UDP-GlcNAc:undecaprenyl-phosphate GlcNAc-1-phosphate transferase